MFTGIIQSVGRVKEKISTNEGMTLGIEDVVVRKRVRLGSSVSISGVCLTVTKKIGNVLFFDVAFETLKKTTLGDKKVGDVVNLESSLRVGDEVGGHFVCGHVDTVVQIKSQKSKVKSHLLVIVLPNRLIRFVVPRGSIAVDGVSLTVARIQKNEVTVALVPFTLTHTTLGNLKKGDCVNIEIDTLTKMMCSQ